MQIRIVQCPKCGEIQGTLGQKGFRCKICNASRHLRKVKVLGKTGSAEEAQRTISALKEKMKNPENKAGK